MRFCNLSLKRKYLPVNQMAGKNTAHTQGLGNEKSISIFGLQNLTNSEKFKQNDF